VPVINGFEIADGADAKKRQILWNVPDTSVTYTLEYAEVKNPNGGDANDSEYEVVGGYVPITVTDANFVQGKAVVNIDFSDKIGKNYIFKLTASKNGAVSETEVKFLNEGVFATTVAFSLSQIIPEYQAADTITLALSDGTSTREIDHTFTLYRRVTTNGKKTVFAPVAIGNAASYKASEDADSWTFQDSGLDLSLTYEYKIVAAGFANSLSDAGAVEARPNGYNSRIESFSGSWSDDVVEFGDDDPPKYRQGKIPVKSIEISGNGNLVGLTVTVEYPLDSDPTVKSTTTGTIGYASSTVPADDPDALVQKLFLTISPPTSGSRAAQNGGTVTVKGYSNTLGEQSGPTFTWSW